MLTQSDLLPLWEAGRSLHPLDQGILALTAAFPEAGMPVADWPLGRRNAALAQLRAALFAGPLRGWTACPGCAERLEFDLDAGLLATDTDLTAEVTHRGMSFRLPTTRDLAAVARLDPAQDPARALLDRCCLDVPSPARAWQEQDLEAIGELMSAADPLSDVSLSFRCPACDLLFEESLDLPAHLWMEIEARVRRLLTEVHRLALAYGWSEREILALSPARRAVYLGMVGA
jgi:hypothetical protein